MKLHVIESGSKGNCYVLTPKSGKCLIIDCGVSFDKIQKEINFDYNNVAAVLLTHEHKDHSKSVYKLLEKGITVFSTDETARNLSILNHPYHKLLSQFQRHSDEFTHLPFELKHDVPCVGFVIYHSECGQIVFATDTSKLNYIFPHTKHFIIEANYCEAIIEDNANKYVSNRVKETHLSIQKAVKFIKKQDLSTIENIILIHLSNRNSDELIFKNVMIEEIGIPTHIASDGLILDLSTF